MKKLILLSALLLVTFGASAQQRKGSVSLSGSISVASSSETHSGTTFNFTVFEARLGVDYFLTNHFALGAGVAIYRNSESVLTTEFEVRAGYYIALTDKMRLSINGAAKAGRRFYGDTSYLYYGFTLSPVLNYYISPNIALTAAIGNVSFLAENRNGRVSSFWNYRTGIEVGASYTF